MLLTLRVLEFPDLRVLDSLLPSLTRHYGALIPIRDTSTVTISPGKGSGDLADASGNGTGRLTAKWRK